VSPNRR